MRPTSALAARLAAEVRAEMARKTLTVTALAASMGLHRQTVGRLVNSQKPMDIDDLVDIGSFLGVEPEVLIARATAA